ncbi:MAG TPA: recombinase family protein [Terriglobales bacterium]|nr:recombinase family protein [Terriglobales bacterium]
MSRAALYLRVSTVDQHPETQLHDLRGLAAQRGLEIVAEYTDRISGAKGKRPGLDQLLADGRRGKFDVLLIWAFDRIARSVRHFGSLHKFNEKGEKDEVDPVRSRAEPCRDRNSLPHLTPRLA